MRQRQVKVHGGLLQDLKHADLAFATKYSLRILNPLSGITLPNCLILCDLATAAISLCSVAVLLLLGGAPFISMWAYCWRSFISTIQTVNGMNTHPRRAESRAKSLIPRDRTCPIGPLRRSERFATLVIFWLIAISRPSETEAPWAALQASPLQTQMIDHHPKRLPLLRQHLPPSPLLPPLLRHPHQHLSPMWTSARRNWLHIRRETTRDRSSLHAKRIACVPSSLWRSSGRCVW